MFTNRNAKLVPSLEEFSPTEQQEPAIPMTTNAVDTYEEERKFVFKGPLSEAMTQALQQAYAKENPVEDAPAKNESETPSLESAAQDQQLLAQMLDRLAPADAESSDNVTIVYGVPSNNVETADVINLSTAFQEAAQADSDEEVGDRYAIVIDGTKTTEDGTQMVDQEKFVDLTPALEALAETYGVRIYRSLADLQRDQRK